MTTKDPAEYWAARWRIMEAEVNTLDIENRKLRAEVEQLKAAVVEIGVAHVAAQTEAERLRAEVRGLTETIEDWQQTHGTFTTTAAAIQIEDECDADD